MTTITGRPVFPYYQSQLFPNFCGPACADMILASLGIPEPTQMQIAIYGESPVPSDAWAQAYNGWITRPDELVKMIHGFAKPKDQTFGRRTASTSSDFRKILKDLVEDQTIPPPITPIHGNTAHWVIFFQYRDNAGNGSFYGYDPFYLGEDGMPLTSDIIINVADQSSGFQNGLNFIAVAKSPAALPSANESAGGTATPGQAEMVPMTNEEQDDSMQRPCGSKPMTNQAQDNSMQKPCSSKPMAPKRFPPQKIPKQVMDELKAYGVIDPDNPESPLKDTSPGTPLFVKRTDAPSGSYYLTGLQNSVKKNRLLVRLDARNGKYLDSIQIPATEYLLGRSSIWSNIHKKVCGQLVTEMKKGPWFQAFQAELSRRNQEGHLEPSLIWEPCEESPSPFYPFYRVVVDQTRFFVRIDGVVFPALTPLKRKALKYECNPQIKLGIFQRFWKVRISRG